MKKFIFLLAILSASPLYAQCPLGGCPTRTGFGYTRQVYQAVQPCQAVTTQPCAPIQACAPVETVQPCAPIETTVEPCAPVETCQPVETVEPCAPVETCDQCEYTPSIVARKTTIGQCVNGSCPLRATAQTVATGTRNVVSNTLKGVAALLDRVNATRARYGLAALQVADLGAQRQAAYCASTGTLTHGSGVAEILAQNGQGFETAIQQWLQSPGHRALLLNGGYRYADVGVVRSGGRVWCAVRFR